MAEMTSADLFPQLKFGSEVFAIAKVLIKRLMMISGRGRGGGGGGGGGGTVLGDRTIFRSLGKAKPPGKGGLDVLGRRWGREGALKKPPTGSGPRRGGGHSDGERAGWGSSSAVRIRAEPGTWRSGGSSGSVLEGGSVCGAVVGEGSG